MQNLINFDMMPQAFWTLFIPDQSQVLSFEWVMFFYWLCLLCKVAESNIDPKLVDTILTNHKHCTKWIYFRLGMCLKSGIFCGPGNSGFYQQQTAFKSFRPLTAPHQASGGIIIIKASMWKIDHAWKSSQSVRCIRNEECECVSFE